MGMEGTTSLNLFCHVMQCNAELTGALKVPLAC